MSDGNSTSITIFGELSKPVTVLVERISDAIGAVFEPTRIRRRAEAEADAARIEAGANFEISALEERALRRSLLEEAIHQSNIESILGQAIPRIEDSAPTEDIDPDWIAHFFTKSRTVSDDEMQGLWARILAGEANSPGTVSKRTLGFVSDMDKSEAEAFSLFCQYSANSMSTPMIFDHEDPYYVEAGITFNLLTDLQTIGLIQFEGGFGGFGKSFRSLGTIRVGIADRILSFDFPDSTDPSKRLVPTGQCMFTKMGEEMRRFVKIEAPTGYYDKVVQRWTIKTGFNMYSPLGTAGGFVPWPAV